MPQESMNEKTDGEVLLGLLNEVEADGNVTQRSMAARLGVALGLTNAYLKRAILKGWVKAQEVPKRRYMYYLTPTGFAEKSRLAAQYLSSSFAYFRTAHEHCLEQLQVCKASGWRRIVLYGGGELAQVAALAAMELKIDLIGVVAPGSNRSKLAGLTVFQAIEDAGEIDAVMFTDIEQSQTSYDRLVRTFPPERVVLPGLLGVAVSWPHDAVPGKREAV